MSSPNEARDSGDDRVEALREAMTMVLYVSIVLLATLIALPTGSDPDGAEPGGGGVHGLGLIGVIWGTTVGLAMAHWLSFRLTARAFGGGRVSQRDLEVGLAQIAGAASVALLCSIPALLVGDSGVEATTWVPAGIIGIAGYAVGRASDREKPQSLALGVAAMILGLTVATVKNFLLGH